MTGRGIIVESVIARRSKCAQITSDVGRLSFFSFCSSKCVSNEVYEIVFGYSNF